MVEPGDEGRADAPLPSAWVQLVAIMLIFFGGAPLGMAVAHLAVFTAAGVGYGLVARALVGRGLLPFPDEF